MNSNEILAALRKAAEKPFVEISQTSKAVKCAFCNCKEGDKSGITKMTTLDGDVVYDLTRNPPILPPKFAIGQCFNLNGDPCEIIGIDGDILYKVRCKNIVFAMNKAQLSDLKPINND